MIAVIQSTRREAFLVMLTVLLSGCRSSMYRNPFVYLREFEILNINFIFPYIFGFLSFLIYLFLSLFVYFGFPIIILYF